MTSVERQQRLDHLQGASLKPASARAYSAHLTYYKRLLKYNCSTVTKHELPPTQTNLMMWLAEATSASVIDGRVAALKKGCSVLGPDFDYRRVADWRFEVGFD